jgi:hypothetical protein
MVETAENVPAAQTRRGPGPRISKEVKATIQAMFAAGIKTPRIAQETGASQFAIRKMAERGQWSQGLDNARGVVKNAVASTITREVEAQSQEVLGLLSSELLAQARLFATNKPKTLSCLALGRTATVNTLATACDKVFGWSKDSGPRSVVQIGTLNQIDVSTPQPVVSCGVETGAVMDITEDKPAESDLNR